MEIEVLRDQIWGYLFRAKGARSIGELARQMACDETDVRAAINHEWFTLDQDQVSIAYAVPVSGGNNE